VSDPTALAAVEQTRAPDPLRDGRPANFYALRGLERFPLGESYVRQATRVKGRLDRPELSGAPVAVDETGVGRAVVDILRAAGIAGRLRPVTIVGGATVTANPDGSFRVPKKDLVGALQVALQGRRFAVASGLPLAAELQRELANFRMTITAAAHESYGPWRESIHDDLVLAAALAVWLGERLFPVGEGMPRAGGSSIVARAPPGVFGPGGPPPW
jgi:hypothetical protein